LFTTRSPSLIARGNLPILTKTLPNNFGICFNKASDAIKTSYLLAHFLIFCFYLLNAFNPSTSIESIPAALA
jgi:hypothetical protein